MEFLQIADRKQLQDLLRNLNPGTPAKFGLMSPQHMIEHLIFAIMFSNGKAPQDLIWPENKADRIRGIMIDSSRPLPMGFKIPLLPENDVLPLIHSNLDEAISALFAELDEFDRWFTEYPDSTPNHPTMGALGHGEWIVFHNKHFTHHFGQFGLV